jgi:hypothetical protein
MRLSAALLQTTFAQTQLSVDADLVLMQEWAAKFHVHASQQADHGCSLLSSSMCVFFVVMVGLICSTSAADTRKGKGQWRN